MTLSKESQVARDMLRAKYEDLPKDWLEEVLRHVLRACRQNKVDVEKIMVEEANGGPPSKTPPVPDGAPAQRHWRT